jgi:saccharopine dehydrogenase (NAD+, L-lysine-forming)
MVDRVKNPKMTVAKVDVTKSSDLKKLLNGKDLVISSVSWGLLKQVLNAACETKTNYMDFSLSGNSMEEFREQQKMAEKSGITGITACGADPGMSDVFARYGADKLDVPEEAYVRDGDCGVAEGYNFFTLWSPVDMLEEGTTKAAVFVNGKHSYLPPLHKREIYNFPDPIGPLPVYNTTHEETFLMPEYIKGIKNADFKIAIDDEWAAAANMLRKLGLHSLNPIDVKGVKVRPIDVVVALMPRPVELAGKVKGYAGIVVEVIGKKNGKRTMVKTWTTMSHEKAWDLCRSNATGYLVGVGGAVGAELLLAGEVKGKGLFVPEQLPVQSFVDHLPAKGLDVKQEIVQL